MGDQQGQIPTGNKAPRRYRIFALNDVMDDSPENDWVDFGWWPGASPQSAVKAARAKRPHLQGLIAEGKPVLPIAEGDFHPLVVTVETIEREAFKATEL